MPLARKRAWGCTLFALGLLAAYATVFNDGVSVEMALLWLPAGAGVAGVALLGSRALWVVAAAGLAFRLSVGYGLPGAVSGALGATAEAFVGAWLLRRLGEGGWWRRWRCLVILVVELVVITIWLLCVFSFS